MEPPPPESPPASGTAGSTSTPQPQVPSHPPSPAGRFAGRSVLVTGASRGLGRAIALAFAAEGAWVAFHSHRHAAEAESALAQARAAGGDGMTLQFDVVDRAAVDAAVTRLCEMRGGIDVLVNNAGIAR